MAQGAATDRPVANAAAARRRGSFVERNRGPLLVTPALVTLFVMNIFPLMWSFGLSFYDYRLTRQDLPRFVGLDNYARMLADPSIWESLQTTALIVAGSVGLQMILGFFMAMLFQPIFPGRRILLMLVLAPMMLSYVAVGVFFKLFYNPNFGLISKLIEVFQGTPPNILGDPVGAVLGIIFADAWMWSPFVMLLVLAGLVSVPKYLYEASQIDRATPWRRFWTITFPYVRSLLLLALLFRTIETFKLFDTVYIITEGGPGTATKVIVQYLYRVSFQDFRTGESSAIAYVILFIVIVLTNLYLFMVKRREQEQ
jgi:multiple sugar transport system permease protein